MWKWLLFGICLSASLVAQEAPIPSASELPGRPYAIKQTWVVGGAGDWDYLTLDPGTHELFIARQTSVQVVDVSSGSVSGEIKGFAEAHEVVLDPNGQVGYASDGRADVIRVFDRRTLRITANIPIASSPRALVFEPQTRLLFSFGSQATAVNPTNRARRPTGTIKTALDENPCNIQQWRNPPQPVYQSLITVIDPGTQKRVADIQTCGLLGAAEADGAGHVFFTIVDSNEAAELDASAVLDAAHQPAASDLERLHGAVSADGALALDFRAWTASVADDRHKTSYIPEFQVFGLGRECQSATAIAVDAANARLFASCANQVLQVVSIDRGSPVASLTIGPGTGAIAYDAGRELIFTANGGGYGSLTVIRRDVTDTYSVIQNLPTLQQARTLALDAGSGNVYLVTALNAAKLGHPPFNGIGTLKLDRVDSSFQVLVVGN